MEKRVKIIEADEIYFFERKINDFLSENAGKLHEIKFEILEIDSEFYFVALLSYTPSESKNHKNVAIGRINCS